MKNSDKPSTQVASKKAVKKTNAKSSATAPSYVVAIGASAGGLEALENIFAHMPNDTGMGFVVVQHLSPTFKSLMGEILARKTTMPVQVAKNRVKIRANQIYLIPAKSAMTLKNGCVVLTKRKPMPKGNCVIDTFLSSLAEDQKERSAAIILSGTGSDGMLGVQNIHKQGGIIISQSIDSAAFDSMPRSAISTNFCHAIAAPEEIPKQLLQLTKPSSYPSLSGQKEGDLVHFNPLEFQKVFEILKASHRIEFDQYKLPTINRRINRRMETNKIPTLSAYCQFLEKDQKEIDALYQDLLIGVTEFFRDPKSFSYLAQNIIPDLLKENPEEIRIWSIGCATAEEAYSLAIIVNETAQEQKYSGKISIFATDIDHQSLAKASSAVYHSDQMKNVSPSRKRQFFSKEANDYYRINSAIRKQIVFSNHNILADPPFTRIDIITCRNLMIYFKKEAQETILSSIHFALKPEGIIFIGSSDNLFSAEDAFTMISEKHNIAKKNPNYKISSPKLPYQRHLQPSSSANLNPQISKKQNEETLTLRHYEHILSKHVPSGLIINEQYQIEHYFGDLSPYLDAETGRANKTLLERTEGELRLAITTTLRRSQKENHAITTKGIRIVPSDPAQPAIVVDLTIDPLPGQHNDIRSYHITFTDINEPSSQEKVPQADTQETFQHDSANNEYLEQLSQELNLTKANLSSAIEDLQTSNEELQTSNEELLATNEELQSTNEELGSVNEELITVNSEYSNKNLELKTLNDDHNNLLESLDIGIIFLDRTFSISKFNQAASSILKLLPQDIGRPLADIAYHYEAPNILIKDISEVIHQGITIEKEVLTPQDTWLLRRAIPYFGDQRAIQGAIITFTDITDSKSVQLKLDQALTASQLICWEWNITNGEFSTFSRDWCILGYLPGQTPVKVETWWTLIHPDDIQRVRTSLDKYLASPSGSWNCEHRFLTVKNDWKWVLNSGKIIKWGPDGTPLKMTGTTQDISLLKLAQINQEKALQEAIALKNEAKDTAQEMEQLANRLNNANNAKSEFLSVMSHEIRTPLNPIIGLTELLLDDNPTSDQVELLNTIHRSAGNLLELLNDILDFTKIESGILELKSAPFNLIDTIDEVVSLLQNKAHEKSINLSSVWRGCPPQPHRDQFHIYGDAYKIRQVLLNLISNALKFTESGSITAECQCIRLDEKKAELLISISDTGVGIPAKNLQTIFEPFSQVDASNTRLYGGSGLGLAICQRIIHAMGGEISVQSTPGQGSTFQVRIELNRVNSEQSSADITEISDTNDPPGKKILLVEDNPGNRILITKILSKSGFSVKEVTNGQEAIRHFDENLYDLVLMDVNMPHMDGLEATRAIRKKQNNGQPTPIIGLTADVSQENQQKCIKAGMDHVIHKPFNTQELIDRLHNAS